MTVLIFLIEKMLCNQAELQLRIWTQTDRRAGKQHVGGQTSHISLINKPESLNYN